MYFYGPVPSRRLGFSLGVDLIPKKVCSFDCVYCHVARTTQKTAGQFSYVKLPQFTKELKATIAKKPQLDYITISGSGEPTLHKNLDKIIGIIKQTTKNRYPVCVITNSSLLYRKSVRRALRRADLIIPSLDAATPRVFEKINRPLKGITIDKIINGLIRLRKEFKGKIWLEIMVVRGINDTLDEAFRLREAVAKIKPDKVQLNIPVRPAWADIALPDKERVREIAKIIGGNIEIIARFNKKPRKQSGGDAANVIIEFLKRRPANLSDLEKTLGISRLRLNRSLRDLISRGKIKEKMAHGEKYFIFCGAKNKI